MDFLTKDMGEDRWFCTLLVEKGWKLEYCAIAANSTYCPDTFDEFFKQRRRWGPSTFANLLEVLNKQKTIRQNNNNVNIFFVAFQILQLASSIISPSTILLFMAFGLTLAFPAHYSTVSVLFALAAMPVGFTLVCMYCKPDTQLQVAKILAFVFAMIMCITTVGCLLQIFDTSNDRLSTTLPPLPLSSNCTNNLTTASPTPLNTSTRLSYATYVMLLVGVYLIAGLLHGTEVVVLLYGVLYWLALPTGSVLLTIYSIANLTDRSWGTREIKDPSGSANVGSNWKEYLTAYFKYFCWCCVPPQLRDNTEADGPTDDEEGNSDKDTDGEGLYVKTNGENEHEDELYMNPDDLKSTGSDQIRIKSQPSSGYKRPVYGNVSFDERDEGSSIPMRPIQTSVYRDVPKPPPRVNQYQRRTSTLAGLKKPKRVMPSKNKSILRNQQTLNKRFSILFTQAMSVEEWLSSLQYQEYIMHFKDQGFENVSFIAGSVNEKDLVDMGITSQGHRKKLLYHIEYLPPFEHIQDLPDDVEGWLINLGLERYWSKFKEEDVKETKDLAQLKAIENDPKQISERFNITKRGHLRKLTGAVKSLQYATKQQKLVHETRNRMSSSSVPLKTLMDDERMFWERLKKCCLLPEQDAFNQSKQLGEKLSEMRTKCFYTFFGVNILWSTFIVTIVLQGPKLHLMGESFIGIAFTFLFMFILLLQFLSLLVHRMETLIHFIARAPGKLTWNRDTDDREMMAQNDPLTRVEEHSA